MEVGRGSMWHGGDPGAVIWLGWDGNAYRNHFFSQFRIAKSFALPTNQPKYPPRDTNAWFNFLGSGPGGDKVL